KIVDGDPQVARPGVKTIDVAVSDLALRFAALILGTDAVGRIREPYCSVGFHDDVIGRVQALALIALRENRDLAAQFRAGDPASPMLAGDETALAVAGIAVGEIGW